MHGWDRGAHGGYPGAHDCNPGAYGCDPRARGWDPGAYGWGDVDPGAHGWNPGAQRGERWVRSSTPITGGGSFHTSTYMCHYPCISIYICPYIGTHACTYTSIYLNIVGYLWISIYLSMYMYDASCSIHDAFPMRHTYASYSDAFMTRSVSDASLTRLISSVE